MVHTREVRPLKFRSGIASAQLLDVVMRRAGFGDGKVESAQGAPILHTQEPVPDGHYFFTPWPKVTLSSTLALQDPPPGLIGGEHGNPSHGGARARRPPFVHALAQTWGHQSWCRPTI